MSNDTSATVKTKVIIQIRLARGEVSLVEQKKLTTVFPHIVSALE